MSDSMTLKLLGNGRHYTPKAFVARSMEGASSSRFGLVANASVRSW